MRWSRRTRRSPWSRSRRGPRPSPSRIRCRPGCRRSTRRRCPRTVRRHRGRRPLPPASRPAPCSRPPLRSRGLPSCGRR
ncbi:hypothetical protein FXB39_12020 [Nocardioides sp. BGMRC 2183]|nr:hypothetical protein FXB39_12020 [Nocardioides sp. BGMRC 2183]